MPLAVAAMSTFNAMSPEVFRPLSVSATMRPVVVAVGFAVVSSGALWILSWWK
jgi:hypothetical protein